MKPNRVPYVFVFVFALVGLLALLGIAQQSLTEAPAAFATPTLSQNPGAQSVSNGIAEPAGDTYALDQSVFEKRHGVDDGLGPVFNATACVDCHQNPVTGGPTVPIRLPAAPSSTTALSARRLMSNSPTPKISEPSAPC